MFGATAFAKLHDVLLHELLEVVTTARLMNGIDALRVVDVVGQVSQLAGRIPRQPCETRLLPKASQEIEVIGMLVAVVVGASWPVASRVMTWME